MTVALILSIIFIHWIADFVLQTDKQAKGKSKNFIDLLSHTLTYSFIWMVLGTIYAAIELQQASLGIYFGIITFIAHTITDYFTSKLNTKLWMKGEVHYFFVSVGFDQVLHYVQLFLTYKLLTS